MCIGIPMQVLVVEPGHAVCIGRGETRRVETALVGPCTAGDWLLIFLESARDRLDTQRASEINAALDLLAAGLSGLHGDDDPGFVLPSAMSAEQMAALTGQARSNSPFPDSN
ncbi:MAG: HypC/HybG/HupF family hydrogenase formation chaperone [Nevskia sp.]|jgi:hydrogenase expression/formation protein HypC|nr:HypC/HybG/HupF family hydrogenase formation chaperone [Nevskia sp.]